MKTRTDELIEQAANGNRDAAAFLYGYLRLGHRIDDIVDIEEVTNEYIIQTFMEAVSLFSLNRFYVENSMFLYPLMMTSLNNYAQSVDWEKHSSQEKRQKSDHLRSDGINVINFVALRCGSIERMRDITPCVIEDSYRLHHDALGNPN